MFSIRIPVLTFPDFSGLEDSDTGDVARRRTRSIIGSDLGLTAIAVSFKGKNPIMSREHSSLADPSWVDHTYVIIWLSK